jgi:ribose transport system permease protein
VIIGGGLDLSVAEVISTANVFAATFRAGRNELFLPITVLTLAFGALVGLFNGLLITRRQVPAFVATLGSSIVLRGARLMWTKGLPRGYIPDNLNQLGVGTTLGIPNLFYVFLAAALLASLLLTRRLRPPPVRGGHQPAVATLSGIRTGARSWATRAVRDRFRLRGHPAGGYTDMSDQRIGEGYDLDTIAVAVLGGAAIGGGSGSVRGTVIAAVIILVITNLSLLMGFPIQSQMLIKGLVIVLALWLNGRRGT